MIVALAVAVGAVAQSLTGVGFVLVCGPFLVAALGPEEGVRTALVLSAVVNVAVLAREHAHVRWSAVPWLLVPAAVATPLLVGALRAAPDRLLEALAGLAAVVGAAVLAVGLRWRAAQGRAGAVGAGVVSAAMNVVAGIGGPAVVLWADNAGWSRERTRSTLQVYFLALNVVGLASLGLPTGSLVSPLGGLVAGLLAAAFVTGRVSPAWGRRTTLALAATGGVVVLVRALAS